MIRSLIHFSAETIKVLYKCEILKCSSRLISSNSSIEIKGQFQILFKYVKSLLNRKLCNFPFLENECKKQQIPLMEFDGNWPIDVKQKFLNDMIVIDNFISPEDEISLMEEIEPYLKRLRYERDHWDDAIQGFRETERKAWYPHNKEVINRVIAKAFPMSSSTLPHIHVLDLEATGRKI